MDNHRRGNSRSRGSAASLTILQSPPLHERIAQLTGDLQAHARELWGDRWKDNLEAVVTANSPEDMVRVLHPQPEEQPA